MRITIIGSGNVATHLAAAFKNAGHLIVQVYSRDMVNAALLAYHIKAEAIDDLNQINPETDLFLVAAKDDAIAHIAQRLAKFEKLTAHTSGGDRTGNIISHQSKGRRFLSIANFQ